MRAALYVLAMVPLTSLSAQPVRPDPQRNCRAPGTEKIAGQHQPGFQRLGDLPPAAAIRAVLRTENGCPRPVVLRRGIGANPEKAQPIIGGARPYAVH